MAKREIPVVTSQLFDIDLSNIYEYGVLTFGIRSADQFIDEIYTELEKLCSNYELHAECRHLRTQSKKYRNIILGSYIIVYRITTSQIQVLRAFHSSRAPSAIKSAKRVQT